MFWRRGCIVLGRAAIQPDSSSAVASGSKMSQLLDRISHYFRLQICFINRPIFLQIRSCRLGRKFSAFDTFQKILASLYVPFLPQLIVEPCATPRSLLPWPSTLTF